MLSVVLFVLSLSAASLALPTQSGGGCPGGYAEGAEIERGRLIYVCQGGNVVPKGCIAEDLSRIPVGGHYDNTHYRRTCTATGESLSFDPTGCVSNGQEHKASETFEDATNFYVCQQNAGGEPALKAVVQGCVESGKRVPLKEKVNKDDAVWECQETTSGGAKLVKAGCVKNGKTLAAGESFEEGKFWYNCSKSGRETFSLKTGGCVANGKRLNDGDRFTDNDVIYECTIDANKNDVRAVACVQAEGSVERKLGCTWVEGAAPFQYEWRCEHDAAANTAKKVQVRCNYNVGGGTYNIDPGCYRVIEKAAFGCVKEGAGLKLQSFQGDNAEQSASGAGLHAC